MACKVSVLLSVYNDQHRIGQSIESILTQSLSNLELIIINDGSTDDTSKIIHQYQDNRIRIIENSINLGLTVSLNKGLAIAAGDYIARQDSGDVSLPDRLLLQTGFLDSNKDFFLVGSGAAYIDNNGKTLWFFNPVTNEDTLLRALRKKCAIMHSTIIFRNDTVTTYREKFIYAQDYDLYLNLISQGKRIVNMPDILLKYLLSPNSISSKVSSYQGLFAEKASLFFHQRNTLGKDEYDTFDPDEILTLGLKDHINQKMLSYEIAAAFKTNNFPRVRQLYPKLLKYSGIFDECSLYFLASFLPATAVNFLRRVLWR